MIGAINFLNDCVKVCESRREDCDACPCLPVCQTKNSLRYLSREDLRKMVSAVTNAAKEVDTEYERTLHVTLYTRETRWDPAEGGIWLSGELPRESVEVPAREIDAFLERKCKELLTRFEMTDADIEFRNSWETRWRKGKDVVFLLRTRGRRLPVANFVDCGKTPDGEYREDYNAYLAYHEDYDPEDENFAYEFYDEFMYVPESVEGMHTKPLIYS